MKNEASDSGFPSVDVVIATFRRPEDLERCLKALDNQTVAPASIAVSYTHLTLPTT